ncbi:MAG: AraC family transcriptional regulator [Bryobacteraceae bacterium]|nr:AraC family transcriptional regulator [Bryobacteraceae bacterium]
MPGRLSSYEFESPAGPWRLWTWAPSPDLAHAVSSLWATEAGTVAFSERVIARQTVELMINLAQPQFAQCGDGERKQFRRAWVSGLQQSPIEISSPTPPRLIAASLHAALAPALLGVKGPEITSAIIELDEILAGEVDRLADRLNSEATTASRFMVFEQFLRGRLKRARLLNDTMAWAVGHTFATGGRTTASELSRRTGYSVRYLEMAFHEHVGLSPKRLCRLVRFGRVIAALPAQGRPDWSRIAAECGYYDQAHMHKDFRRFTGMPPGGYIRERDESNQAVIVA